MATRGTRHDSICPRPHESASFFYRLQSVRQAHESRPWAGHEHIYHGLGMSCQMVGTLHTETLVPICRCLSMAPRERHHLSPLVVRPLGPREPVHRPGMQTCTWKIGRCKLSWEQSFQITLLGVSCTQSVEGSGCLAPHPQHLPKVLKQTIFQSKKNLLFQSIEQKIQSKKKDRLNETFSGVRKQ